MTMLRLDKQTDQQKTWYEAGGEGTAVVATQPIIIPDRFKQATYQPRIDELQIQGTIWLFNLLKTPIRELLPLQYRRGYLHCSFQLEGGIDPQIVIPLFTTDGYIQEAYRCLTYNLEMWHPGWSATIQRTFGKSCHNILHNIVIELSQTMDETQLNWFAEKMMLIIANPRGWYQPGGLRENKLWNIVPRSEFKGVRR